MEAYPTLDMVPEGEEKTCHMAGCGKKYGQFETLIKHMKKEHQVTNQDLEGHWVYIEQQWERKGEPKLGPKEEEYVDLVVDSEGQVDELKFRCKVCEGDFHKRSVLMHMVRHHSDNLSKPEVLEWLTYKDANLISKKPGQAVLAAKLSLRRAFQGSRCSAPSQGQEGEEQNVEEEEVGEEEAEGERLDEEGTGEPEEEPTLWRATYVLVDSQGNLVKPIVLASSIPMGGAEWLAQSSAPPSTDLAEVVQQPAALDLPSAPIVISGAASAAEEGLSLIKQFMGLGWQEKVPLVRVSDLAKSVQLPLAKGDEKDVMRSGPWPK